MPAMVRFHQPRPGARQPAGDLGRYPGRMTDPYPLALRLGAILGLAVVLALAVILADVASGGKILGDGDCGCKEAAPDE
jgi:hypothetical protein